MSGSGTVAGGFLGCAFAVEGDEVGRDRQRGQGQHESHRAPQRLPHHAFMKPDVPPARQAYPGRTITDQHLPMDFRVSLPTESDR